MTLPARKILPHDPPSWIDPDSVFFISINCRPRGNSVLDQADTAEFIRDSLIYQIQNHLWFVPVWLNMPDHVHAFLSFPRTTSMKKSIQQWKKFIARNTEVRWQRDFFDHRIRNEEEYREKLLYIENNPVRAGLVEKPSDWPYLWYARDLRSDG